MIPRALLSRVIAPDSKPITLDQVKDQTRVSGSDDDVYLESLISRAVAYVDAQGVLGRAMITQTWAQSMQYPNGRVHLKMATVQSLSAVKFFDDANVLQTATLADYRLVAGDDFAYVEPVIGSAWPTAFDRIDAVRVEFVAGYGLAADVPENICHALLLLVGHWYQNRENTSETALQTIPHGFEILLNNHRLSWYG